MKKARRLLQKTLIPLFIIFLGSLLLCMGIANYSEIAFWFLFLVSAGAGMFISILCALANIPSGR